ncbi:MAG: DinB family protein [Thermoanaerobaculia bacterium]
MNDELASLYAYNRWADDRTAAALRSLPPGDYTRELGGGWPSPRATFVHLAGATNAWSERFIGCDATTLPAEADLPLLENAVALLEAAHTKLEELLPTFSAERMAAPFTWKNLAGKERTAPFWAVLRHVVNHGTYHRGQISSMVRRLGGKPLATDMVVWGIEISEATQAPSAAR